MKNIQWKKVFLVVVPLQILAWVIPVSGLFNTDGLGGGYAVGALVQLFMYAATILAPIIVLIVARNNRFTHFLIALLCAVVVQFFIYHALGFFSQMRITRINEHMYAEDPNTRPLLDPERPISMIEPYGVVSSSPVQVTVYAKEGVLTCTNEGCGKVLITEIGNEWWVLGEGNLMLQRHLSPEGRNVYQSIVSFDTSQAITVIVGVEGFPSASTMVEIVPAM